MFLIKHKILIVDDQPGIRLLLQDVFTNEGYGVILADTGMLALERIYEHSFDLVILDYNLPLMNGRRILDKIPKEKSMIPIIVMSGLIENIQRDFRQDINVELIAKPFDIKEMIELVKTLIERNVA